jgi:WD40 repeat protein
MIDGILQDLLANTWEAIETRELQRETERTRVRIPEIVAEGAVEGTGDVRALLAERNVVFIGCGDGVRVADEREGRELATSSTDSAVTSLAVEQMGDAEIVAACMESGSIVLLAYIHPLSGARLIKLADLPSQEEGRKSSAVYLAPSCSHMALTTDINHTDYQVECYVLPKSAWKLELVPLVKETSSADGENSTRINSTTDMVFSKPTQLFNILPPKPLVPCSSSSQHNALLNVLSGEDVIATGEHHLLTTTYLNNRRRAFETRRSGFVQHPPSATTSTSTPHYHFLYFKNGSRQEEPQYLLVWWKTQTQLLLYSLSAKGSSPVLGRVIPQGSCVCVTAVSRCTRYLAVGLESGVISTWDLKTNFCHNVQQVVPHSDMPTALMFCMSSSIVDSPTLAVGTKKGSVVLLNPDLTTASLNQRLSKQQEAHQSLFDSSGCGDGSEIVAFAQCLALRSVLMCVHVDGSVVLWSMDDLEALCKVALPSNLPPTVSTLSNERIFLADGGCVRYLHLLSVKFLKKYHHQINVESEPQNTRHAPGNFMQFKLDEFNTKMFKDNDLFQASRLSKWDEYIKHLSKD